MDATRLSTLDVAAALAGAPFDQPWQREAPARHLIRQALCLAGWKWWVADRRAFILVARARRQNGVRQPGGWDVNTWPGVWPECWVCGTQFSPRMPWGLTCSKPCQRRAYLIRENPVELRHCAECTDIFEASGRRREAQQFCSKRCQRKAITRRGIATGDQAERTRRWRETPGGIEALARYAETRSEKRRLAKLNGHTNGQHHAKNGNGSDPADRPDPAGDAPGPLPDPPGADAGETRMSGADRA